MRRKIIAVAVILLAIGGVTATSASHAVPQAGGPGEWPLAK